MDQNSEKRLWQVLDSIAERLSGIENNMIDIVRLQERLTNHEEAISRYGRRLDEHGNRVRQLELWQADHGDPKMCSFSAQRYEDELKGVTTEVKELATSVSTTQARAGGQNEIGKTALQWIAGIIGAIIIYKLTKGHV